MKEIEKFYSDLYAADDVEENYYFLNRPEIPKLSQEREDNKSPGNDGLTVEFYKTFWNSIGTLLVDSLNYSYECGEL